MSDGIGIFFIVLFMLIAAAGYMQFTEFLGGGITGAFLGLIIVFGGMGLISWLKDKASNKKE